MKTFPFLLGIILLFISCEKKESRFMTEKELISDLEHFRTFNSKKLDDLTKYGVNENSDISLVFYFATDDSLKAQRLVDALVPEGYHVNQVHRSARDKTLWALSGSGSQVKMDLQSLTAWTNNLCQLGYNNDCEFQGWNPVSE